MTTGDAMVASPHTSPEKELTMATMICPETIEIEPGGRVLTEGVVTLSYKDGVPTSGVLGCSLEGQHTVHAAHLNHDLATPALLTWRTRSLSDNDALLATARSSGPMMTAAVELLIWLGKNIPVHPDRFSGLYVDTRELARRSGVWSGGERRVVAVALSLLDAGEVDLRDVIGGTGGEHRRRIVAAIAASAGIALVPAPFVVDQVPHGLVLGSGPMTVAPDQIV